MSHHPSRRDFLTGSVGLLGAATGLSSLAAESAFAQMPPPAAPPAPKRVAMINSIYRFRSHAYHLGRRILSGYDHRKAREMVDTARRLNFPLMAGSSLPVTWRSPELELPLETKISEGLVVFGYDRGPAEIYFFHALEALQCMLERREGGESGIETVVGLRAMRHGAAAAGSGASAA